MAQSSTFELRKKLLQLEALYDVGRALNTLRPEGELIEELMHRAIAVLDATVGFVFSLDEKLNVQQIFTFGVEIPTPANAMLNEPPIKQVLASREPMSVTVSKFLGGAGSDLLLAPMISGETIIGIIGVGGKEERGAKSGSFVEDDLRFLASLAAIGGAAIDNARNFHKLSVLRETLEDENRNLKQRMLRDYSDRLMICDSPKLQRVIELVARVADSQASVLIRGEAGTGKQMIEKTEFRQDLYYRLKVVEIVLPPLRDRKEDIPKLVRFFLDKYGKREGLRDVRITQEALQKLMRYPFPGNVRELENLIEGSLALTTDPVIDPGDLALPESASGAGGV